MADRRDHISERTLSAFTTPGIIHFCIVLFVAATLSAPWPRESMVTLPLIAVGLGGVVYIVRTWHRMKTQQDYDPVFEDWAWHVALPLIAYVVLGIGRCSSTRTIGQHSSSSRQPRCS